MCIGEREPVGALGNAFKGRRERAWVGMIRRRGEPEIWSEKAGGRRAETKEKLAVPNAGKGSDILSTEKRQRDSVFILMRIY